MADPECIRKYDFEPSYSFRRDCYYNMNRFRRPMHSSRYFKEKMTPRNIMRNRRSIFNSPFIDDEEVDYRRRKAMRYSSSMTGSMFEDEEEYYNEYARRESERAYKKLKKEIEGEQDEYVKTMLEVTLMEMKLEHLQYEVDGLKDEHRDLQRENYILKEELDAEMGFDEDYAPPAKKARSPNIPLIRAGRRNKGKSIYDRDEDEPVVRIDLTDGGFKYEKEPNYLKVKNDVDFYDYDATSDIVL